MAQVEVITKDVIIDVLTNNWLTKPELFKKLPPIREQSTVKVINDYLDTLTQKGIVTKKIIKGRICFGIFKEKGTEPHLKQTKLDQIMPKDRQIKKTESRVKIGKTVYTKTVPKTKVTKSNKKTSNKIKKSVDNTQLKTKKEKVTPKTDSIEKKDNIKKESIKKKETPAKSDLKNRPDQKPNLPIKSKSKSESKSKAATDIKSDQGAESHPKSKETQKPEFKEKTELSNIIEKEKIKVSHKYKRRKINKSGILPTREYVMSKKEEVGADRAYQQLSPAEFFKKNKAIAGFDNDQKAVYTTIRELVENSIDAAEAIEKPPDIFIKMESLPNNRYKITIRDNGSGVPDEEIPKCFGILLYGSKYIRKQGRGAFGFGGKMAILYGQISTLEPVEIKSSTNGKEIYYYKMRIDIKNNEPIIEEYKVIPNSDNWTGTEISFKFKGDYPRVRKKVLEYLNKTAIITPHAEIEYIEPIDERCEKCRSDRVETLGDVIYCKKCSNKFIHNIKINDNFTLKKIFQNKIGGIDKDLFNKIKLNLSDILDAEIDKLSNLREIYNKIEDIYGSPIGITKDNLINKIFKLILKGIKNFTIISKKYKNISEIDVTTKKEIIELIENINNLFKYVGGKSFPITSLTPANIKTKLEHEKKFLTRAKNFDAFLLDIISGLGKKTLKKVEDEYGENLKIDIFEAESKIDMNKLYKILYKNLTSGLINIKDLTFEQFKQLIEEVKKEKIKYISKLKDGVLEYIRKDAFLSQKEPYKFINNSVEKCPYCNSSDIIQIGDWRQCQVSSCKHNYLNIYRHIYRRGTTELPPNPTASLPHPHGIDADTLLEMIKAELSEFYITYEPIGNYSMQKLLRKNIKGIGKETLNKIEELTPESLEKDADKFRNVNQLYKAIEKAVGHPIGKVEGKKTVYNINNLKFEEFKEIINNELSNNTNLDSILKKLFSRLRVKILNEIKKELDIQIDQQIPSNIDLEKLYKLLLKKLPKTNSINVKELTLEKLKQLIENVKKDKHEEFRKASPNFYSFMNKRFQRTGKKTINNFCEFARQNSTLKLYPETLLMDLDKDAIVKITDLLQKFPFMRPDASCLAPIGEQLLLKGIMKEMNPEWASTVQRPPEVCEGHPFIIEMGLAYGGKIDSSGDYLQRFANRIPLLYESSMGVCATAIKKINWRHYKLDLDKMPIHIFIHIVSTKIPWGRFGKEYIANKPEIRSEIEKGIKYLAGQLRTYLSKIRKKESIKKKVFKLKIFGRALIEPLAELVEADPSIIVRIIYNYIISKRPKKEKSKNLYKNFSNFFDDLSLFDKLDLEYLKLLVKEKSKNPFKNFLNFFDNFNYINLLIKLKINDQDVDQKS
ncbi:MAG: ATP-binding protein [Candidatus Helarchaeota archaeon]